MSVPSSIAAGAAWRGAGHRRKSDCYLGSTGRRGSYLSYETASPRRSRGHSIIEMPSNINSSSHSSGHHLRLPGHSGGGSCGRHRRLSGDVFDGSRVSSGGHSTSASSAASTPNRRHSQHRHSIDATTLNSTGHSGNASRSHSDGHHHHHHHHHHNHRHQKSHGEEHSNTSTDNPSKVKDSSSKHENSKSRDGRSKRSRSLCLLLIVMSVF